MKLRCEGISSIIIAGILYAGCLLPADAQNVTCTTRPIGDDSNACASTAFVKDVVAGALPLQNGRIYVGNASNIATGVPMGGDCTIVAAGTITCTKTNGVAFGPLATVASTAAALDLLSTTQNAILLRNASTWVAYNGGPIYASAYGVVCDGSTDDTTAAQEAITAAAGRPVIFPTGTCVITSSLTYTTSAVTAFAQGLQIEGQGRELTIFDNRVASDYLFKVDTSADFRFQAGVTFKNFKIRTTTSPASSGGIKLHKTAYALIQNVQINALTGNGIYVEMTGGGAGSGDADGSFFVKLDRVRMDSIAGWCFDSLGSGSFTENSYIHVTDSTFATCGTTAGSATSGAMRWRGLTALIENSSWTTNNNVALLLSGNATPANLTVISSTFENTASSFGPSVLVTSSLRVAKFYNAECLNNDSFIAQGCMWFQAAGSSIIGNVDIDGVKVRATTNNSSYVAFSATGANLLTYAIKARNIYWQDFGYVGQTQFSGPWFFPQTGAVDLSISALNTAKLLPTGRGNILPIRLGGTGGTWVGYPIPTAGVTGAITGGSATTTYNIYAYNSESNLNLPPVIAFEASTTARTLDDAGYYVKTGDASRVFVGTAISDGSGDFQTTATITSWFGASGVTSVVGTANEISSSCASGTCTLSLPAAMTFTGKTVTGGTFDSATIANSTIRTSNFGINGTVAGSFGVRGSTSGTITVQPQAAAGTYNWNWPTSAGSANQILTSQGGGATAQSYQNIASLLTAGTGISISGTTNATIAMANMAANTIKGNNTGGSAAPTDLTVANVKAMVASAAIMTCVTGVDFNAVADTAIAIALPTGFTTWNTFQLHVSNKGATASLTTAQFGVFSAAGGGGTAVYASGTAMTTLTSNADNTASSAIALPGAANARFNFSSVFFRITTPQGAAASGDVCLTYRPLP